MWRTPGKPARAPVPALCPARGSHTPLTCTRLCGFACLHFVLRVCTLSCAWLTHASAWFCVPALCLRLSSSLRACTSYARGGQPLPGANRSARGLHFVCARLHLRLSCTSHARVCVVLRACTSPCTSCGSRLA